MEEEIEVEFTSRSEYISCAYYAIEAVEGMNVMSKADADRKLRIQRKCLKIIDSLITEMHDELFEEGD